MERTAVTGAIPFAVTLPKVPDVVNVDRMTEEQFHLKLKKGYDDIEAGNVRNAADAFDQFRKSHSL